MKVGCGFLAGFAMTLATATLAAQSPLLGSIETPHANIQSTVHIAGLTWGAGTVPYGPVGTPLILSGSDLGDSGTIQFIGYKNGAVDPGYTVQATATLWTPTMIFVTIPSGAKSGMVTVTSAGKTSNPLPAIVTPGTYAGTCPAYPSGSQLQIVTTALSDGMTGQSYSASLTANGGTQAYTWSITGGSLPSGLTLNASTGVISGTPAGAYGPADLTVQVQDSSSPQQTVSAVLSLTITGSNIPAVIYSYSIPATGGYDSVGNVLNYTDSVTGTWSFGYDTLNRLTSGSSPSDSGGAYAGLQAGWSYDSFGNRTLESFSGNDLGYAPVPASTSATYNANNQIQTVGSGQVVPTYDAAGNILTDTQNQQYLYDAEGRICAVNGLGSMTGYIYDAEGNRVAKGSITVWNCDTNPSDQNYNHFTVTTSYILSQDNQQLTELTWSGGTAQWAHTNVWAAGELIATYSPDPDPSEGQPGILNFYLTDWLGTRRVMTDSAGNVEENCPSLPYGNGEGCAPIPTEHLFTGKERDSESGNDYFGARYYASTMGRWMSPDWSAKEEPVPYAKLDDPQTLNLYSYVENNPLVRADPDGHCCLDALEATMDEVDAVAKPLIESAVSGVSKGAGIALDGAAGVVGFLFTAGVQSTAPAKYDQLYNEETGERYVPEPKTSTSGAGARKGGNGTIYKVPGSATKSGKPYIGRHNKPNPAKTRRSKDGRDRSKAEVVDTYDASNVQEGRTKEQQQIDANGGVQNLDNKRNEIKPPTPPNQ